MTKPIALGSGPEPVSRSRPDPTVPPALSDFFLLCDGFYAFESALHVFPTRPTDGEWGLFEWNRPDLWRQAFPSIPVDCWFFAEDVFGGQFAITDREVGVFDPETGEFELLAEDLDGWAAALLADWRVLTGQPLGHQWQLANGPLRPGRRLLPKVPFVLGGAFAVDNLYDADAVRGMRYRGELSSQIRDLPDNSTIRLQIIE